MSTVPTYLFVSEKRCRACRRSVFDVDEFECCRSCSKPLTPNTLEETMPENDLDPDVNDDSLWSRYPLTLDDKLKPGNLYRRRSVDGEWVLVRATWPAYAGIEPAYPLRKATA